MCTSSECYQFANFNIIVVIILKFEYILTFHLFANILATLQVPKSPRTPTVSRGMGHVIAHRFTKAFKVMTTCDFCEKQMYPWSGWY